MPICKGCGNRFNDRAVIDGIERQMRHRVYCLDCHPFAVRGKQPESIDYTNARTCKICNRTFDTSYRWKGLKCPSCATNHRRFENKQRLVAMLGGKCRLCGYDRHYSVLDFHHLDPATKKFNISGSHSRSFASLVEEAKKCILLCCRCHREFDRGLVTLDGAVAHGEQADL